MTQGRKSQRYLSGRSKIIGFSGLSTDRHLYVEPGQVEPNLGFPGEKSLPASGTYYKLITVPNGNTYDRYWQEDTPATLVNGITIFDEGTLVGTANTVSKLNFVGAAVTATASGTISTITVTPVSISTLAPPNARSGDLWWDSDEGELNVYYQDINSAQWVLANSGIGTTTGSGGGGSGGANVTVSSNPPTSPTPANGDLWWDSDVGELFIYYTDGDSNQWVETSGGSETVTISDNPPSSPNDGDLWWESDTGSLKIYYNDGDSQQWVDSNAGVLSSLASFTAWSTNSSGIHTTANVGIGTTNVSAVDSSNTATLAVGIVTAHKLFGDGSNLTGVGGTVVISTGAPSSADVGDLWWDSDDGDLLVYFNDGDSSQWVSTTSGSTGAQGAQGATGGAQGAVGAQGAQGAGGPGAQGAQGNAGAQGAQGQTGSGSAGAQGNQGYQGNNGAQGAQGNNGAQGAQGNNGAQGSGTGTADKIFEGNSTAEVIGSGSNDGEFVVNLQDATSSGAAANALKLYQSSSSTTSLELFAGNKSQNAYLDINNAYTSNASIRINFKATGAYSRTGTIYYSPISESFEIRDNAGASMLSINSGISGSAGSVVTSKLFLPNADDSLDCGSTSRRWSEIHAVNYYGDGSNLTGISGTSASRTTANATTSSLVVGASGNITITAAKVYALLKIQTSAAAWVTLYTDSTSRSNDSSRNQTTDPTPGSGVIAEVITTGSATQIMTPGIIGWNNDGTPSTNVYAKVKNTGSGAGTITVTLHYLPLET